MPPRSPLAGVDGLFHLVEAHPVLKAALTPFVPAPSACSISSSMAQHWGLTQSALEVMTGFQEQLFFRFFDLFDFLIFLFFFWELDLAARIWRSESSRAPSARASVRNTSFEIEFD